MKYIHNDVIDRDVDQFDEEPNETHDGKANCSSHCDLLELCFSQEMSSSVSRVSRKTLLHKPLRSGLVHRLTNRMESFVNLRPGSTNAKIWSILFELLGDNDELVCGKRVSKLKSK